MKKDDKELEEFLRKEKAYYQFQRSMRSQVNVGRPVPNTSASTDYKILKNGIQSPDNFNQSAQLQQQHLRNIQEKIAITKDQLNGNSPNINIFQQQYTSQSNSTIDSNSKSQATPQIFHFNKQKDAQSSNFHKIYKSISSSQTDINSQIKVELQNHETFHAQTTLELDSQEKQYEDRQTPNQRELISRNTSLILPKSSHSSKAKYINGDSYNIFTATAASFKTKRNSMSNTIFLTPLQSRAQTPTSAQVIAKNDIYTEASEVQKTQSNLQKALNNFGISSKGVSNKDQKQNSHSRNTLKRITQNDTSTSVIQQQLNNSLLQSKLSSYNKIPASLLEDKTIQIQSSLLTGRIQHCFS